MGCFAIAPYRCLAGALDVIRIQPLVKPEHTSPKSRKDGERVGGVRTPNAKRSASDASRGGSKFGYHHAPCSVAMVSNEAQDALKRVHNPDRLLEGEDPDTKHLDDAKHWLYVYGELLGFKESVVGEAESSAVDLPADAQPEADADLTILEAERQRLRRRYGFWQARVAELQPS
jgi:hypothetical protein